VQASLIRHAIPAQDPIRRRATPTSREPLGDPPAPGLTIPAAAPAVAPQAAEQAISVSPETAARIDAIVGEFLDSVIGLDPHGAEFARRVAEVGGIAQREIQATTQMSGRLLDWPLRATTVVLGAKAPIARKLRELRREVEELDPARHGLDREADWERSQERYSNGQARIEEISWALAESRNRLLADNAALKQEERALWTEMETLRQYAYLVRALDDGLERRIGGLAGTDPDRGQTLRLDVLFPVRQRLQDILTQLAVATQGYAALRIVQHNNDEVIRAIATATTTTSAALRTAAMVAQAVVAQRLIRANLASVETGANRAASAGGGDDDLAALRLAWDKARATLDEIDRYSAAARASMLVTVRELTDQVERARASVDVVAAAPDDGSTLRI
jgi:hypothetical protein